MSGITAASVHVVLNNSFRPDVRGLAWNERSKKSQH
jgi:hypothetical protein